MKVEILYFDGCPNHVAAVRRVLEVLRDEQVSATVSEVNVGNADDAHKLRFLGSPTIRINGLDIEPSARCSTAYGMVCRTYTVDGRRQGLPPRDLLQRAILEACGERGITLKESGKGTF